MRCGTVITTSPGSGQHLAVRTSKMNKELKLLAVLAHPDDESFGLGGTLAKYAAEGVETYLVTATRGECGRFGALGKSGNPVEVGRVREAELRAAAAVLGIREVSVLGYPDGAVDTVQADIAIRAIVTHMRRRYQLRHWRRFGTGFSVSPRCKTPLYGVAKEQVGCL